MELAIRVQIEELPEGLFLATSDELPGLVAQGRTVAEVLEIARDVARKLIEARHTAGGHCTRNWKHSMQEPGGPIPQL